MIKIIATDLDGTLLYPKSLFHVVPRKNVKFVRKFVKNGGTLVLISGRTDEIAKKLRKIFNCSIDMIACNGTLVLQDDSIICDNPIDFDILEEIYNDNLNNSEVMSWTAFTREDNMIIAPNKMGFFKTILYFVVLQFLRVNLGRMIISKKKLQKVIATRDRNIYKMMVVTGVKKQAKEDARILAEKFKEKYGDKVEVFWANNSVEIVKKGFNKADALKKLADMLKFNSNEIAVVGDSGNDVPLFQSFENSFVMKHSHNEIKKEAKTVINGVWDLEKYINK